MSPVEKRDAMATKKKSISEAAWNQMNLESKQAEYSRLIGLFGDQWTKGKRRSTEVHNEMGVNDCVAVIDGGAATKKRVCQDPTNEVEQAGDTKVQDLHYLSRAAHHPKP